MEKLLKCMAVIAIVCTNFGCQPCEEGSHREGDYCITDEPESVFDESLEEPVGPLTLDVPFLARLIRADSAIEVTAGYVDETDGAALANELDAESLLLVRHGWDQISDLRDILPERATHIWALAHAADLALGTLGYAREDVPESPELTPDPGETFRTDFGNLVDQAVGTKAAFDESTEDPVGTQVCMAELIQRALPFYLQTMVEGGQDGVHCALHCLARQMDLMVQWCVWNPDATLSDPYQSDEELAGLLADLCADRLGEDGDCIWDPLP